MEMTGLAEFVKVPKDEARSQWMTMEGKESRLRINRLSLRKDAQGIGHTGVTLSVLL